MLTSWDKLKRGLKKILYPTEKELYFSKLVDNIEKQYTENNTLPFKIKDIKEKGFIVNIAGLIGYISFNHMPWYLANLDAWKAVFPYIKGKIFFGKIYQFRKKPLSIVINGDIPQFKKPELIENSNYKGVVINKTFYGAFVDIGFSFNWRCGSFIGLLHKSNFESIKLFENVIPGQIIELKFWGYNEKGQPIFGNKIDSKEWCTDEIEKLVGKILPINIIKTSGDKISFLVENKYSGIVQHTKQINKAILNLENGDIIHCRITQVDKPKHSLRFKWESKSEIERVFSRNPHPGKINYSKYNTLQNRLDNEVVEKLKLIGATVNVEVIKTIDSFGRESTKYLVEDKYIGKLKISDDFFLFGIREIKQIEKNLHDGEIISCKVLSVKKKLIVVQWNFNGKELHRFFR